MCRWFVCITLQASFLWRMQFLPFCCHACFILSYISPLVITHFVCCCVQSCLCSKRKCKIRMLLQSQFTTCHHNQSSFKPLYQYVIDHCYKSRWWIFSYAAVVDDDDSCMWICTCHHNTWWSVMYVFKDRLKQSLVYRIVDMGSKVMMF